MVKIQRLPKSARQMERHVKGIANHYRIATLFLIAKNKELSVENIATRLDGNVKTIAEHVSKLERAGLIAKHYKGHYVLHELTPYGKQFIATSERCRTSPQVCMTSERRRTKGLNTPQLCCGSLLDELAYRQAGLCDLW